MTLEEIQTFSRTFFEKLWVELESLTCVLEAENIYRITLKSPDSHILIGPHGKNLEALTQVLKLMLSKKNEKHTHLHLEINDYLEQKDAKLLSFIQAKIDLVTSQKKDIILPFFTAYERKKVHSYVSEKWGNIYTQSHGEGAERRVHLCYKSEKMTIDLDWDDI